VDGTQEGSISHFLAGLTLLRFYVFVVVGAAELASPPTLTWSSRIGGGVWMPYLALSYPIVAGGAWLIHDPWLWMLVKILAAFIPIHGFLPEECGFLPGSLGPAWVRAMTDVRIPLIGHYHSW
jgi:hypothetical protein